MANDADYFTVSLIGCRNQSVTAFKQQDGSMGINGNGLNTTLEKFIASVTAQYGGSPEGHSYQHIIALIRLSLGT